MYVAYVCSKIVGRLVLLLLLAYLVAWYVTNYGTQVHYPLQWSHPCLFIKPRSHYYREFYSPDIVWDSAQMILTLKLSSVAINYSDGIVPKEKKTPAMVKNEIHEIPAILPYFGECALCAVYDHYHYQCLSVALRMGLIAAWTIDLCTRRLHFLLPNVPGRSCVRVQGLRQLDEGVCHVCIHSCR